MEISQSMNEEPVQLMLIAAHTGLNLVSIEFQPYIKVDDTLLCGLLSALSRFSDEMFLRPLDSIKIGEHTLLMRVELPFLFCYVFKGQIKHANRRLDVFIESIQRNAQLWKSLMITISTGAVNKNNEIQIGAIANHVLGTNPKCIERQSWKGSEVSRTKFLQSGQSINASQISKNHIGGI
jgi:hypothetical protein